jgi:hypothetical protein
VEVKVKTDGHAAGVRVVDDPAGHGFAREAIPCAMAELYQAALDRRGQATRGWSQPFRVIFSRW